MEKKLIWQDGDVQFIQISCENLCVNAVLINDNVVHASTDWNTTVEFLNRVIEEKSTVTVQELPRQNKQSC